MRGNRFRALVALPTAALGIVLTTASAHSVPDSSQGAEGPRSCLTHPRWSNKDGGSGYVKENGVIRTGPHNYCDWTIVGTDRKLFWHCWTKNEAGNKWTHVRVSGTNANGWVWDGNLTGGGSNGASDRC